MAVIPTAADAPVPVAVARGLGGADGVAQLRASPDVRVVHSPRHAAVLVVAGQIPRTQLTALALLHDQVPRPRAVAAVGVTGDLTDLGLGTPTVLGPDDPTPRLRRLHAELIGGAPGSPDQGPADNPTAWEGVGPHGQGGEGMMGGTPYGRPMAMPPVEGRDGLALDRLPLHLGPFLPGLPAGLVVRVGLQGDVLEEAELHGPDLSEGLVGDPVPAPLPDGDLAPARALAALADLCALAGLEALATRAARVAVAPDARGVRDLRRRLDRRWGLRAATDGVGGPAGGDDVTARWRRWLDIADGSHTGAPAPADLDALGGRLVGMEVGQALLVLCAAQLEVEAATRSSAPT